QLQSDPAARRQLAAATMSPRERSAEARRDAETATEPGWVRNRRRSALGETTPGGKTHERPTGHGDALRGIARERTLSSCSGTSISTTVMLWIPRLTRDVVLTAAPRCPLACGSVGRVDAG